jgi:hypothetical protein
MSEVILHSIEEFNPFQVRSSSILYSRLILFNMSEVILHSLEEVNPFQVRSSSILSRGQSSLIQYE